VVPKWNQRLPTMLRWFSATMLLFWKIEVIALIKNEKHVPQDTGPEHIKGWWIPNGSDDSKCHSPLRARWQDFRRLGKFFNHGPFLNYMHKNFYSQKMFFFLSIVTTTYFFDFWAIFFAKASGHPGWVCRNVSVTRSDNEGLVHSDQIGRIFVIWAIFYFV
jgi:hypothetical protein